MPIRILPREDRKKKTTGDPTKWITKKKLGQKTTNWITKKKTTGDPTKPWVTKKKKTPNIPKWPKGYDPQKQSDPRSFGRKSPYSSTNVRTQVIDALSGGREGKPHSSPEGREASAGRKLGRLIEKSKPFKKGGRIGYAGGSGNRPRPHGPHTWVKTSGAVMSGKKVGIQIK